MEEKLESGYVGTMHQAATFLDRDDAGFAFEVGFLPALVAAALAATFFSAVFAVDAFLAGAVDFVAGFLPGALAVVFFAVAFFGAGAAAFFVAAVVVFLVAAGFFALDTVAVAFVVVFLEGASTFLTGAFFTAAGFFAGTGFAFSSSDADFFLGASLTLPEGPLGKAKMPAEAPEEMARLSWYKFAPETSTWYVSSANFLIVALDTPLRASSLLAEMHSLMMSFQEGCEAALTAALGDALGVALVAFFDAGFLDAGFLALDEEAGRTSIGGGETEVLEDIFRNRNM